MERRVEHFEPWNPMEPEVAAPWLWSRERGREGGWSRSDSERSAHKNRGAIPAKGAWGDGSLRAVAAETPTGALADYSVQLTFRGRWVWDISSQESKTVYTITICILDTQHADPPLQIPHRNSVGPSW